MKWARCFTVICDKAYSIKRSLKSSALTEVIYVIDNESKLLGEIAINRLLALQDEMPLNEILLIETNAIEATTDIDEAADQVIFSGKSALPIIDENGCLTGRLDLHAAYKYKEQLKDNHLIQSAGLSEEDAEAATKTFESFDDEKFEAIVATLNKVSTQDPKPEEVEAAEAEEATEAEASKAEETSEEATEEAEETSEASEVLDSIEVEEEVNLGVGQETDSEVENTRAALVDFVYSRLGKK